MGDCWGAIGKALEGVEEDDFVACGGERALRVERRREFKFFRDIVNKVMIVLCVEVLLLFCCILL
jgi:hypothetical protein